MLLRVIIKMFFAVLKEALGIKIKKNKPSLRADELELPSLYDSH